MRTLRPSKTPSLRRQFAVGLAATFLALTAPYTATPTLAAVLTFQQGAGGYTGNRDAQLRQTDPNWDSSTNPYIYVYPTFQGLTRFDNIFGNGANQIPPGSTITSATLQFTRMDLASSGIPPTGIINLHRMLADWASTDTWNSMGNGVQLDDVEARATATVVGGGETLDVTSDVQAWLAGANNRGWVMVLNASSPEYYYVYAAHWSTMSQRPKLTVEFTPPAVPVKAVTWGGMKARGIGR